MTFVTNPIRPRFVPPIAFHLEGEQARTARVPAPRVHHASRITSAEGTALLEGASRLWLAGRDASGRSHGSSLRYTLPASFSLGPMAGHRVRVTVQDELAMGVASHTLTISGADGSEASADGGKVWLLARYGRVQGVEHVLDGTTVRAALSQRAGGPLVIGTTKLQWLVAPGQCVCVGGRMIAHYLGASVADGAGCAAYVIADLALLA